MIGLLLSLAISASAAEVPFFNREVKSARDVGSLNENFRATSDAIRKADLTNGGTIDGTATIDEVCFPDATCQTTAATSGLLRQYVSSSTTGSFSAQGSAIPEDNSKPQISEGYQVLVATITPINASSTLKIEASVNVTEYANKCNFGAMCFFKDSNSDAIACATILVQGAVPSSTVVLRYSESSGSTQARNYSVRVGCDVANTIAVNLMSDGTGFGKTLRSYMDISEIGP